MGAVMTKDYGSFGNESLAKAEASTIPIITHAPLPKTRRVAPEPEYMPVASRAPETSLRRLEGLLAQVGSAELGTQIGMMKLRGEITEAQWSACDWFAQLDAKYLLALDAKGVKSGSAELTSKAEPPDPLTSETGLRAAKRDRATVAEFDSAYLAAMACGRGEYLLFRDVVVDDAVPTWAGRRAVQTVSEALRRHRAADSRHRRGRR